METKKIYTATEARKNFFDILNRVLYGNERMFIKKSGSEDLIKIERSDNSLKSLKKLAGSISKKDARIMKEVVKDSRKAFSRQIKSFD
ncbi:hypothetical protein COV24_03335 [candidate division WWE3 bacterium CG10_big_fil_rev_8_21_14_0_10_32_10]|uniref:Antitoxin n=1 Tax=candidate division WWE3 bacterium CG10_big_fil_rev_8_21_14_0_10_32_10 TaxID=1975090 RepID=A0A2H0R9W9_UNCKA|nr:MAG: hypothetical protein COV24_03335 [candidate division WWE3 bacterium CG10_big_fil_rev_8_21_14_0_10_32_10]